ncbi:MAG: hypothetical protein LBK54_04210 [Propionibacteriaceae bacterium]|nr:hypothetical protein [Propionibacteriaceae bacterium]
MRDSFADLFDDFGGLGVDLVFGGDGVSCYVDVDLSDGAEELDESAHAHLGGRLDPRPDRQGGEHNRQVRLDRVLEPVEDRAGRQVVFGHAEGVFDVPQVVVGVDDRAGGPAQPVRLAAFRGRVAAQVLGSFGQVVSVGQVVK